MHGGSLMFQSIRPTVWTLASLLVAFVGLVGCGSDETTELRAEISGDVTGLPVSSDQVEVASQADRPPRDPSHPVVRIETSLGSVVVELDAENAPITVKNFLWYASSGHYQDTIFHQVVEGYVLGGGGYTTDLVEKPTYITIRNEAYNKVKNLRGTIAMTRRPDVVDSSTCQFFINLTDNPQLDYAGEASPEEFGYCVFGKVIEGQSVVDQMAQVRVADRKSFKWVPKTPIVIKSVTQIR